MTKEQRKELITLISAAVMGVLIYLLPLEEGIRRWLCLVPYLAVGSEVISEAVRELLPHRKGEPEDCCSHGGESIFGENFLMAAASLGAFALGEAEEAIAVMLLFRLGELLEDYAVEKSRGDIAGLMDLRPDRVNVMGEGGELVRLAPEDVEPGTVIYVLPGERVPLDGRLTGGRGLLDASSLTGEARPRQAEPGDRLLSGMINISGANRDILSAAEQGYVGIIPGTLEMVTEKRAEESTAARILNLVENAQEKKSRSENFITKFARVYTPAVCGLALGIGLLPPVIRAWFMGLNGELSLWVYRALTFLVISCPCALVISVPLTFFAGLGGASREGILIKGSNYLETLSEVTCVVFDKTGTLTRGTLNSGDELKPGAREAISSLKKSGIRYTIMLTGDEKQAAEEMGRSVGIDRVFSELLPQDKVSAMETLLEEIHPKGGKAAYVGDGINDAPVLMRSDVGIAMGVLGTDAAVEAADVVLMDDDPARVSLAVDISRKCMRIVRQNIGLALGIKLVCMALGALGIAEMWMAVFADVGVMMLAVLNALRAFNTK